MRAIVVDPPGKTAESLRLDEVPDPQPADEEVLLRVHATALNRADMMQRMGSYPAQHGASEILGLELAGEVIEAGSKVRNLSVGDRVYGLSGGGGYAEMATLHESLAMPIPDELTYHEAASIPEVFFTANTAVRTLGETLPGERILIHAGGSGVGIAAIQIARLIGAEVWITAGSEEKCERARELGADLTINYREQDFAEVVAERTGGQGVDVILDVIGRDYWDANLRALGHAGRLVLVGLMGGAVAETNLGVILSKRLQIFGTVMRSRPLIDRAAITRDYQLHLEPAIVNGDMRPVIDRVFPLSKAAEAHQYMAENRNFGKILLDCIDVDELSED
ncbi:MAG: NAD(P)H-quinone oxidoreductase [Chloroflexi bacterium]|nr:NAD(P)H-quinone oxidoreductase [Chloroflexota bacterium]MCY3697907.1 NAD(P)H-quinone oxidoreductase [Chloroflexota bacterium]MXX80985.1 NAD(P)H-quinone oxidoreductase [Chloroflexota bacterium]MYF22140.1 NAD(P)H-quinone oxidoreductase [Chloroflexota bacterium]